jgi:hypothetical protein
LRNKLECLSLSGILVLFVFLRVTAGALAVARVGTIDIQLVHCK